MKILKYEQFIKEKLNIQAISDDELDKMTLPDQSKNDDLSNVENLQLVSVDEFVENIQDVLALFVSSSDMRKNVMHVSDRFASWKNLSWPELFKKHQQRASKKMTDTKLLATMYAAFFEYRHNKNVLDQYIDRLMNEYNITESDIKKMYFE